MAQSPNPPEAVVDLDALGELNNPEARAVFDMIDKLTALGVGKIVDLPQIIVVGDQSAGKSTVLGAISQIRFPVHGGVCTRFATELVLSPNHDRRVKASVRFTNSSKPAHALPVDDFDQKDIQQIITSAKRQMGLPETSRDYSKDVLRLELGGPDMCHLTLVDLPGIYHNETDNQSTEGIATVLDIATSYMKKPNSIILAIISASGGFANQAVMREAAKHDPARERTLGVVTKPDLLPPSSDLQKDYLQLVRNAQTTHKLKLGWHVVRNPADYEDDRPADAIENDFFRTGPWSSIPESGRGIIALRKRLSKLLYEHIKKSLPSVVSDIQTQLTERQEELSRLGQPRSSSGSMRQYLTTAAERFRDLIMAGVKGQYDNPFFRGFEENDRKLRAQLRNWNRHIRYTLLRFGSAYEIVDEGGVSDVSSRLKTLPHYLTDSTRGEDRPSPKLITRADLATKLEARAAMNQGIELPGYPNMGLATQLFQRQTGPWEQLALQHLDKVMSAVRDFVEQVVLEVTGPSNERTRNALLSVYIEPFFDAKQDDLATELQKILRPFKESYALSLDADFQDAMNDRAARRRLADAKNAVSSPFGAEQDHVPEFGTEQIVDTVQTFYDMSLRTFTDNLINLVIESCLVQDLPEIFNPSLVAAMDDEQLSSFAAEEDGVTNYRSQLQTEIALLKEGLELSRRNMPRSLKSRATKSNDAADPSSTDKLETSKAVTVREKKSSGSPPPVTGALISGPTKQAATPTKSKPAGATLSDGTPARTAASPVSQPPSILSGVIAPKFEGLFTATGSSKALLPVGQKPLPNSDMALGGNNSKSPGGLFAKQPSTAQAVATTTGNGLFSNVKPQTTSVSAWSGSGELFPGQSTFKWTTGATPAQPDKGTGLFKNLDTRSVASDCNSYGGTDSKGTPPSTWLRWGSSIPFQDLEAGSSLFRPMQVYNHICLLEEFRHWSPEELRLADYERPWLKVG